MRYADEAKRGYRLKSLSLLYGNVYGMEMKQQISSPYATGRSLCIHFAVSEEGGGRNRWSILQSGLFVCGSRSKPNWIIILRYFLQVVIHTELHIPFEAKDVNLWYDQQKVDPYSPFFGYHPNNANFTLIVRESQPFPYSPQHHSYSSIPPRLIPPLPGAYLYITKISS